jgi:Arylsulfotransferase (ASST)
MNPSLRRKLLFFCLLFGVASLSYVLGAAVMVFHLPTSEFMLNSFIGARAVYDKENAKFDENPTPVKPDNIDKPDKTFDGFTLCMTATERGPNTEALLINMAGDVVHKWGIDFSKVWSKPPHLSARVQDVRVAFFDGHLYPNGDLLVVFQGTEDEANGYGLAKLNAKSEVIWKYAQNCHHDVDVGEDGTIYAMKHVKMKEMPRGLEHILTPCLVDYLVVLSDKGKEVEEKQKPIPILEAFRDSKYAPLLCMLDQPGIFGRGADFPVAGIGDAVRRMDVLHLNSVKVLTKKLAPKFPMFKEGQLLISMRHLDTIAVMDPDPESGKLVWAARGPWRGQHDPQFLDDGRLLLFDNLGAPSGSRVLEYDLKNNSFPWSYAGEGWAPFYSQERGMAQRLPNGNTLVVNSQGRQILEVTRSKEVVWSHTCAGMVHLGRRFSADQLPFLKDKGEGPRPERKGPR